MTRIFDALRKVQAAHSAVAPAAPVTPVAPVPPPAAHPAPPPPALAAHARPASPAHTVGSPVSPAGFAALPHVETVVPPRLPDEVARELMMLRIRLDAMFEERTSRVVMFVSSQSSEGTSTVAAEFAIALATDGRQRVLLADFHARRPILAERLGLDPDAAAPAQRPHLRLGETPELAVLRIDERSVRNGALHPEWARSRMTAVASLYDWVVIDGPPVLESPDAVEIAALADGVVLVVQAGVAKRPVVARAADLLRRGGARVLGTVLNRRRLEIPEFIYRRI
jgi:Mrp family chromosome partitioning ATPase